MRFTEDNQIGDLQSQYILAEGHNILKLIESLYMVRGLAEFVVAVGHRHKCCCCCIGTNEYNLVTKLTTRDSHSVVMMSLICVTPAPDVI